MLRGSIDASARRVAVGSDVIVDRRLPVVGVLRVIERRQRRRGRAAAGPREASRERGAESFEPLGRGAARWAVGDLRSGRKGIVVRLEGRPRLLRQLVRRGLALARARIAARSASICFRMLFASQSVLRSEPMVTTIGCDTSSALLEQQKAGLRLARLQPLFSEAGGNRRSTSKGR